MLAGEMRNTQYYWQNWCDRFVGWTNIQCE